MRTLTKSETLGVYRAAYEGLSRPTFRPRGFDAALFNDGTARPISSGSYTSFSSRPVVVLRNVCASDFGNWSLDDTTEDEFAESCLDAFGCIEIIEPDVD